MFTEKIKKAYWRISCPPKYESKGEYHKRAALIPLNIS
jgi:hypothetical protein